MKIPAALFLCVALTPALHAQTAPQPSPQSPADTTVQTTTTPPQDPTQTVTRTISMAGIMSDEGGPPEFVTPEYMTLNLDCIQQPNTAANAAAKIAVCKKVADEAGKFDPASHFVTRRTAYVYYAGALMWGGQYMDALAAAEKAVAVVLLGHDDPSGCSSAYGARAQAKAAARDLSGADRDLEIAEDDERKAIIGEKRAPSDVLKRHYTANLKGLLTYHGQLLNAMGSQSAADAKLAEANKL